MGRTFEWVALENAQFDAFGGCFLVVLVFWFFRTVTGQFDWGIAARRGFAGAVMGWVFSRCRGAAEHAVTPCRGWLSPLGHHRGEA